MFILSGGFSLISVSQGMVSVRALSAALPSWAQLLGQPRSQPTAGTGDQRWRQQGMGSPQGPR